MPSPVDIRSARLRAGLTQIEAAELLGLKRLAWIQFENGNVQPTEQQWALFQHLAGIKPIPFRRQK